MLYVAWKRGLPQNFARFVLSLQLKSVLFISCMFWIPVQTPIRTLVQLKYSSGSLVFHCYDNPLDKPAIVFQPHSSLWSVHRDVDKYSRTTEAPCFWIKRQCYGAWPKSIIFCRLFSWTKTNVTIRNHSTAAVPGLTISDETSTYRETVHPTINESLKRLNSCPS